jgi:hypothetical protein
MSAPDQECNAVFGVFSKRMDLSTGRRCGPSTPKSKGTGAVSASRL